MKRREKALEAQQATPSQDEYFQFAIRIRKNSLAAIGLPRHAQRFGCRYEAGWISTLVEEFYVLIDGQDPRASLVYPLIYQLLKQPGQMQSISQANTAYNQSNEETETGESIDLTDVQDMAKNLYGYLDK